MVNVLERPLTINGSKVTLHRWHHNAHEITINHSQNIKTINEAISKMRADGKTPVFVIEGRSGSGKSILAKVLHSTMDNSLLIELPNSLPMEDEINRPVIIVDEAQLIGSVFDLVKKAEAHGSVLIFVLQDVNCLGDMPDYASFTITKGAVTT